MKLELALSCWNKVLSKKRSTVSSFQRRSTSTTKKKKKTYQVPVALTCNPSYFGGWDREDSSSRSVQANSSKDPISKITRATWTGGVAQVAELLYVSAKPWVQTPDPTKQRKKTDSFPWCELGLGIWPKSKSVCSEV
jgi:hypothetical protein